MYRKIIPSLSATAWLIVIVTLLVWGAVLVAEYGFGLLPCPLCWVQRWVWLGIGGMGILALLMRTKRMRLFFIALAVLGLVISGIIAAWHSGIEYHWWRGLEECSGTTKVSDPAELLKSLAATPTIRCDQAAWTFYGISLAGFNFILSFGLAALIFVRLWHYRKENRSS